MTQRRKMVMKYGSTRLNVPMLQQGCLRHNSIRYEGMCVRKGPARLRSRNGRYIERERSFKRLVDDDAGWPLPQRSRLTLHWRPKSPLAASRRMTVCGSYPRFGGWCMDLRGFLVVLLGCCPSRPT